MVEQSRRDIILKAAAVGGYGAAMTLMHAFGFTSEASAASLPRDPTIGRDRRVIILGGGMAGLVSAYELDKAGFAVTVLEARGRVGGRNWTVRGGDRIRHRHGPRQDVNFGPGHYFNCGPARLPSHHQTILGYCRELGVPLEVEINASRSAYVVRSDGTRVRMRQIVNDTRGLISEMLAKFANQGALDAEIEGVERARMLDFLRAYGDLSEGDVYAGSSRSGYSTTPGAAGQAGVHLDKLDWKTVTDPGVLVAHVFEENIDMQPTMFQPVGGMDQIPKAFARRLDGKIRMGCEVLAVDNRPDGASVIWAEDGETRRLDAAFVVSTIPAPMLARVENNFSAPFKQAVEAVRLDYSCKIAWQAPRFWEQEEIYGGLAYMQNDVRFLWYPSNGLHTDEGVLIGCYNAGPLARDFGKKRLASRLAASRAAIETAHPGKSQLLRNGVCVVWRDQAFNEGPWAALPTDSPTYAKLCAPEGRVHLAGDYLSHVVGWQEGAALSAQRAVGAICERSRAENLAAIL